MTWTEADGEGGRVWFTQPGPACFAGVYRQRGGWWLWGADTGSGMRSGSEATRERAQAKAEAAAVALMEVRR